MAGRKSWDSFALDELRKKWEDHSLSRQDIAKHFGVTVNAVNGAAKRLKLSPRPPDTPQQERKMKSITFAMIKSHAIIQGNAPMILQKARLHFTIRALAQGVLEPGTAEEFYAEHQGKPYWNDLIGSVSGSVIAMVLEKDADDAVKHWRRMMGATDPRRAEAGTLRALYGDKTGPIAWNAVHGSDSVESVMREIKIIYPTFRFERVKNVAVST